MSNKETVTDNDPFAKIKERIEAIVSEQLSEIMESDAIKTMVSDSIDRFFTNKDEIWHRRESGTSGYYGQSGILELKLSMFDKLVWNKMLPMVTSAIDKYFQDENEAIAKNIIDDLNNDNALSSRISAALPVHIARVQELQQNLASMSAMNSVKDTIRNALHQSGVRVNF